MKFQADIFYGKLIQGNLKEAISYLKSVPGEAARLEKYRQLFDEAQYIRYPIADELNAVLRVYQTYCRDVFYLGVAPETAEQTLLDNLAFRLSISGDKIGLDTLEERELVPYFAQYSLHFMGGKTGGYYGPYIWKDTEKRSYMVELPEGVEPYTVYFHKGFIFNSWLSYISFGEVSTGGWADADGIIHCIADCYDERSEAFRVSLLKHEAQHTRDLRAYPNMSQELLEYRAKLAELIYSQERDLLKTFAAEGGSGNGHALASRRIAEEFKNCTDKAGVQTKAKELFFKSLPM